MKYFGVNLKYMLTVIRGRWRPCHLRPKFLMYKIKFWAY